MLGSIAIRIDNPIKRQATAARIHVRTQKRGRNGVARQAPTGILGISEKTRERKPNRKGNFRADSDGRGVLDDSSPFLPAGFLLHPSGSSLAFSHNLLFSILPPPKNLIYRPLYSFLLHLDSHSNFASPGFPHHSLLLKTSIIYKTRNATYSSL